MKLTAAEIPTLKPYNSGKAWRWAALIYNPMAGQDRDQRLARITAALGVFFKNRMLVEPIATEGPGTAGRQAQEAVARGCDAVLACGGDGTVHEVLQGMVGSSAALGVIPLGTANSLAADIGIPRNAASASRALLSASRTSVSVPRIECQGRDGKQVSRYVIAAVGVGPDAHLFYALQGTAKYRLGYAAYYYRALHTWATHDYPWFEVELDAAEGGRRREQVTQLFAVRIANFGGMVRRLAPGAALEKPTMRVVLFKTRSRLCCLLHMMSAFLGVRLPIPGVELVDAASFTCRSLSPPPNPGSGTETRVEHHEDPVIRVEADGEVLGQLPATVTMLGDYVTLLMPCSKQAGRSGCR